MSLWQQHPHNVPPPFQGAPPIPTGVNVPQNYWNQGTWMPNPHYNPQSTRPTANVPQWLPGNGWGIPQANGAYYPAYQQQQSFNPYKRQPKPPSAEYLALKLSDNPLGLTNMVPAEEVERQERERQLQEEEQQVQVTQTTPWLWAPRQLDDDDDEDNDPDQPADTPATPPETPEPFASKATLQPTFSSNIIRTPQHYRSSAPVQIYASPKRPLDRGSSVDNLASEIGRLSTGPSASAPLIRHHSMPATLSTNHLHAVPSITGETLTREPDPMELLSPLAGVLPPPKSASSRSNLGRHSSVPAASTSSLDPIPESSATKSVTHSRPRTPAPSSHRHHSHHEPPPSHSHSKSTSRSTSTSPYSEQSPVSPTVYSSSSGSGHSPYHPHHQSSSSSSPSYQDPHIRNPLPPPPKPYEPYEPSQSFGTHHHHHQGTSNSSYAYMPPSSAPPPPPPPPSASPSHPRSRSSSTAAAPYTQPPTTALSNYTEEPGTAVLHANGKTTVINLSSTSSPHEISSFTQSSSTTTTTTTTSSSSSSSPSTSIDSPKKRKKSKRQQPRRKGFWNRRGDHVTANGYIVYAPPDQVYPADLDGYPDGKDEGYMNEDGHITSWHKRPPYNPPGGYLSIIDYV